MTARQIEKIVDRRRSVFVRSAATALAGSSAESVRSRRTIKANTLAVNDRILVRAALTTTVATADTVNMWVRIGGLTGVVLFDTTAIAPTTNGNLWLEYDGVVRTAGAAGVIAGFGRVFVGDTAGDLFETLARAHYLTASSINMTNDLDLVVTGDLSNAVDSSNFEFSIMDIIRPVGVLLGS